MSLLDELPHLATAKRRVRVTDAMGGYKDTYPTTIFSDRACWRQPASDREVLWWNQRTIDVTHNVYFSSDPGLDEGCVLVIDGTIHDVKSVSKADASVGLGVVWRVVVQEIGDA